MSSQADISILIDRARGGDPDAFAEVFQEHAARIRPFIQRRLGARLGQVVEPEEVVNETFLRASRSIGQFRGCSAESLASWLRTIAQHVIQDQARRAARRQTVPLAEFVEAHDPTPSRSARRRERLERLQEALRNLSEDHRKVVLLARVEGLPIKEVARRMGKDYNATSQLLYRAALKLREAFGQTDSIHLPPDCHLSGEASE